MFVFKKLKLFNCLSLEIFKSCSKLGSVSFCIQVYSICFRHNLKLLLLISVYTYKLPWLLRSLYQNQCSLQLLLCLELLKRLFHLCRLNQSVYRELCLQPLIKEVVIIKIKLNTICKITTTSL